MGAKKRQQDDAAETPAWIVSFADMITLLLAFFVLLQSFAKEQDPELFRKGQGAFRRSISGYGIPDLLFGKPQLLSGPAQKKRHPTKENVDKDKNRERVIDPTDLDIREAFARLKKAIETDVSELEREIDSVAVTPITFSKGDARLNSEARKYLKNRAAELDRSLDPKRVTISIIASSPDEQRPGKQRLVLAARRARNVSRYMRSELSGMSDRNWFLVPMGSGTVPSRQAGDGAQTRQEFVQIAIIGVK
jgi:flagellar motor protein MotB